MSQYQLRSHDSLITNSNSTENDNISLQNKTPDLKILPSAEAVSSSQASAELLGPGKPNVEIKNKPTDLLSKGIPTGVSEDAWIEAFKN